MKSVNRRSFIGSAAISGAALARMAYAAENEQPLKTAVIGCGWFGMVDLKAAREAGNVQCVAICDVDSAHLKSFADETEGLQGSRPQTYKHYEELLDNHELDFVIIATPPQWHALPFLAACERGLDIYCEKPLAYDIREGRAMVNKARETGNTVQIGFQRRQSAAVQQAMQYIREGNAGEIVQIDAQIHYTAGMKSNVPQDPPETLDWDLWCGPAPKLPYTPNIGHFQWRLEKEYGHGHLVDWGIHWIDSIRMVMGETMPRWVQAAGGLYHLDGQITTPDTLSAHFEFGKCPVHWRHRLWGSAEYDGSITNGVFYYGDKATVFVADNKWIVIPKDQNQERQVHEPKTNPNAGGRHMADFLQARREGRQPACPPEDGFRSTATVQLGMIAYETHAPIEWDEHEERITNNPSSQRLLKRDYRAPWEHPYRGV